MTNPRSGVRPLASKKALQFTESVIREMTRLAQKHDAINLAQGFPDFAAHSQVKEAAIAAVRKDVNQYAITWGAKRLRDAICARYRFAYGMEIDPEREVTVTCGSTEAMIATMLALVDPGDEVIVFEPFYENYGPDAILSGAVPRYVSLREPDWSFDPDELEAAFNPKTRAIIINTPNNPTGKVFSREELSHIARLCQKWGIIAVTDEIYEYILYDGSEHVPLASLDGMAERTVTINSISKTYSVTGWRVGWAVGPAELTSAIRKVHDFLTVGAAAPLQEAAAEALVLPDSYYESARARLSEPQRHDSDQPSRRGISVLRAQRGILRHDRYRLLRLSRRRRLRPPSHRVHRRRRGSRFELLPGPFGRAAACAKLRRAWPKPRGRRPAEAPVRVLQEDRDSRCGRGKADEALEARSPPLIAALLFAGVLLAERADVLHEEAVRLLQSRQAPEAEAKAQEAIAQSQRFVPEEEIGVRPDRGLLFEDMILEARKSYRERRARYFRTLGDALAAQEKWPASRKAYRRVLGIEAAPGLSLLMARHPDLDLESRLDLLFDAYLAPGSDRLQLERELLETGAFLDRNALKAGLDRKRFAKLKESYPDLELLSSAFPDFQAATDGGTFIPSQLYRAGTNLVVYFPGRRVRTLQRGARRTHGSREGCSEARGSRSRLRPSFLKSTSRSRDVSRAFSRCRCESPGRTSFRRPRTSWKAARSGLSPAGG